MQPVNPSAISSTNSSVKTTSFISSVKNVSLHFGQSLIPQINKDAIKVNFNPVQFGLSSLQLLTGGGKSIFSTAVTVYGAASALGFIGGASAAETAPKPAIIIKNCRELSEIGTQSPDDGTYILLKDINCNNKNTMIIPVFKGTLSGNNHKISKLREPIFKNITGGSVRNLQIVDSEIRDHSALANVIRDSKITNIVFSNIHLKPEYLGGLVTKSLQGDSSCLDIRISNSNIAESGAVDSSYGADVVPSLGGTGIIIGEIIDRSTLEDARVINSSIKTRGIVDTGGAVGLAQNQAKLSYLFVDNATVDSKARDRTAGGVVGLLGASASFLDARNTHVTSSGDSCRTGGLIGKTTSGSKTLNSNVVDVSAKSFGVQFAHTGILVGQNDAYLNHLSSVNSTSLRNKGKITTNVLIGMDTKPESTHDVSTREDCTAYSFASSPFEGDCSVIPEERIPEKLISEFDVSPPCAGAFLTGIFTGALSLAAGTGIGYLIYKYGTSEDKPKNTKERATLLFKPVMTELSRIPSCKKNTYAVAPTNKQKAEGENESSEA